MPDLSDQEWRYYLSARLIAVWDHRSKHFGTFDARTRLIKESILPGWSDGKINQVKNSLLEKGLLKQSKDFRLEIVNADVFLSKGRKGEYLIRDAESNLQQDKNYMQRTENVADSIRAASRSIALNMRVKNDTEFQRNEYPTHLKEM